MDNDSLAAILINPVGLRYHATHHLFPSLPYHNMRSAHRRLMQHLPADSPYRQTVATSVWGTIADLCQRAALREQVPALPARSDRPPQRPALPPASPPEQPPATPRSRQLESSHA
jgi:fatty acid desaturase